MQNDAERNDLIAELAAVSALCRGGLLEHVASTEENWLPFAVEGPSTMRYDLPDGVTGADVAAGTAREFPQWTIDYQDTLAAVLARYEDVARRSEDIIASLPDLSVTHPLPDAPWNQPGTTWSARRALLHVITETAQHAGHADILREALDGRKAT